MILKENGTVIRSEYLLWLAFSFMMPIWQNILPILLGAILLIRVVFRSSIRNVATRTDRTYLILFVALYGLHALGMLWTENQAHGFFDLQVKVSLVLVPLLLYTSPLDREDLVNGGALGLIAGTITAGLVSFAHVGYSMIFGAGDELYAGTGFSFFMHQGYYASFFCISFILLVEFLIRRHKLFSGIFRKLTWVIVFLLIASILFTLSRTGAIALVLSVLTLSLYAIIKWRSRKLMIAVSALIVLFTAIALTSADRLVGRFEGLFRTVSQQEELDVTAQDANTVRLLLWDISTDLISENLWCGVGTGDIKDELKNAAIEKGYTGVGTMDLNAHNQFNQTFMTIGLPAFVVFLLMFIIPLIEAFRRRSMLLLLVTLTLALFNLTESYIERQAGVMFFAYVLPLLVFHFRKFRRDPTS